MRGGGAQAANEWHLCLFHDRVVARLLLLRSLWDNNICAAGCIKLSEALAVNSSLLTLE